VYGDYKVGMNSSRRGVGQRQASRPTTNDFALLDAEVDRISWTFANLFPGCLMMSDRFASANKKKYFWDQMKNPNATGWPPI